MNSVDLTKPSAVLRAAVEDRLWDGRGKRPLGRRKSAPICLALDLYADHPRQWKGFPGGPSAEEVEAVWSAVDQIRKRISDRIWPYVTVGLWLYYRQGVTVADVPHSKMQDYRKRWALHLADEFEKEGL